MINGYIIVPVACTLAAFLLYKEWKRKKRSRLYGRLAASLLAVGSLVVMAWPFAENNNLPASNKLVLLTNGFINDSITDFLQRGNENTAVFSGIPAREYAQGKAVAVADWALFAARHAADTFHVFGNGFDDETLALLHPHPIIYHAPPALPAITAVYWKKKMASGEELVVQGNYKNCTAKRIKILLQAFGANKDTVFIEAGTQQDFSLHTVPLHSGRAVYNLIVMAGNDTLQKEPVPVETITKPLLQLLIISSSPDFDNTYLKNFLSQQGYPVTLTTAISTNKTDRQFLSMPAQQKRGRLTPDWLSKFDLLIADQETLQKISPAELAALRSAVAEKGMGLLVKLDAGVQKRETAFYTSAFPVKGLPDDKQPFLQLHAMDADSARYTLKLSDPFCIGYLPGTQSILEDARSNIYASAVIYGNGKIVATTLPNTFSIALAGDKIAYRRLWATLLNKAAKKIYPEEVWRTSPAISFINEPVQMQAERNEPAASRAAIDQSIIYLTQDAVLPFMWKGIYWPIANGWLELPRINTASGGWWVYKKGDWQQLINYQYTRATKRYAASHPVIARQPGEHLVGKKPVNRGLFLFIIFSCACIFLWVEQKTG